VTILGARLTTSPGVPQLSNARARVLPQQKILRQILKRNVRALPSLCHSAKMVKNIITAENSSNYEVIIKLNSGSKAMELAEVERILRAGAPTLRELGSAKTQEELERFSNQLDLYYAAMTALRQRPLSKSVRQKGTRRSQRIKK
jgi:hypothetical protein